MKTKYTVFEVGRKPIEFAIDWPDSPGYDRISKLVEPILGGHLERVNVWLTPNFEPDKNGFYTDMFVNDEWLLKNLPINETATKIYRANILTHYPDGELAKDIPSIHGTAVLFHRKIWF